MKVYLIVYFEFYDFSTDDENEFLSKNQAWKGSDFFHERKIDNSYRNKVIFKNLRSFYEFLSSTEVFFFFGVSNEFLFRKKVGNLLCMKNEFVYMFVHAA